MRKRMINALAVFLILGSCSFEKDALHNYQINSIESKEISNIEQKTTYLNFKKIEFYNLNEVIK